ncbi:MAG TPA: hypothetical protein VEU96_28835 [Bryobacteraceae bacterium]|nr:hypothetical protein [Bryobacteraceae bacterium]
MASSTTLARLLDQLEAAKRQFDADGQASTGRLLTTLGARRFTDAESLIRLHEALLFFRAYPANEEIRRLTDQLLASMPQRIDRLRRADADLEPFEEPDVSGISSTSFSAIFTYDMVCWLAAHHPWCVDIDWEATDTSHLGPLLARLHPFYAEDALVEANIPFLDWFRAAKKGRGSDLQWLIAQLESLPITASERAELFAGANLAIHWELRNGRMTRSNLRLRASSKYFYHDGPLLRRSDVSLAAELQAPPLPLERLSRARGEKFLDLARETSAMRFRELHGFTYGDPARVIRADLGRGVELFVNGVPSDHRLPLRAYHSGMYFKNCVPIGYIECLTLFERMEVGFNLYYTFREGETAWLYARILRVFRQLLGITCIAVDPYQIGMHNDEAIDSGAFWFYRKQGFRPANPKVARLLEKEEAKLHADPAYRTSPATLRRLADGWMLYQMPGTESADWDQFELRRAAMSFNDSPFPPEINQAKYSANESRFVRLLQRDRKLRRRILNSGTRSGPF